MLNLIVFGPPGCGKGTQSLNIIKKYELIHLSTGDIFRKEIDKGGLLGKLVKKFIDNGILIPDNIVLKELLKIAMEYKDSQGLIFDGFPRTKVQAEMLDKMLLKKGIDISLVIYLDVEQDELYRRILGRNQGRSDDKKAIIEKRIKIFEKETLALKKYYEDQDKLVVVSGMASKELVFGRILKEIDNIINIKGSLNNKFHI